MSEKSAPIGRIIGLDFETATRYRDSACAIGLCVLDFASGETLEKQLFLINPGVKFDPFNTFVHGITEEMVKDAPLFQDVIGELTSRLTEDSIVVAHNASFDISVLRHSCEAANISVPEMNYFCTLCLSRSLLPGMASYTLPDVAYKCGLPDFQHHLASDDAETCAKIFLHLANMCNVNTISDLARQSHVYFGHTYTDGSYSSCHKARANHVYLASDTELEPPQFTASPSFDEDNPFLGKTVVFTGALQGMPRSEAESIVTAAGGIIGKGVTKKTNFIVCGYQDPAVLNGHKKSSKLIKAEQYAADGCDIQIIPEELFRTMIS